MTGDAPGSGGGRGGTVTSEPSRFWKELADQHREDLESLGYDVVKRRQALRYFTWSPLAFWYFGQFPFLLRELPLATWRRCALVPQRLTASAWHPVRWDLLRRWLYGFEVRLLWEFAKRHGEPRVLALEEPALGTPLPVDWDGRLVSQDLANSALEAKAIVEALAGRPEPREIVEIGAGYGRSAYALLHLFPSARYTIVDIEPAISISRWYLGRLFPQERLRFLDPSQTDEIASGGIDLALSISSLQEMTPPQVGEYLRLVDRVAHGGVCYLKQWTRWRNPADRVSLELARYPYPDSWTRLFFRKCPVQTTFSEGAWTIGA